MLRDKAEGRAQNLAKMKDEVFLQTIGVAMQNALEGKKRRKALRFVGADVNTQRRARVHYKMKVVVPGEFTVLTQEQIVQRIKMMAMESLSNQPNPSIRVTQVLKGRNWWRGGWPNFYRDATEEDFILVVFLGLPLLSRPLAWLYDRAFPRVKVVLEFSVGCV